MWLIPLDKESYVDKLYSNQMLTVIFSGEPGEKTSGLCAETQGPKTTKIT